MTNERLYPTSFDVFLALVKIFIFVKIPITFSDGEPSSVRLSHKPSSIKIANTTVHFPLIRLAFQMAVQCKTNKLKAQGFNPRMGSPSHKEDCDLS